MILPFVQLNFTYVVDRTECTNYGHMYICALHIWFLIVHLKTAIHSRVLPLQWVMQTLGHCHLFKLSADEIPSTIHSLKAYKVG